MAFGNNGIPWNKGVSGYKMPPASEARKKKISIALKGNTNATGFTHSEATKLKMSKSRKGIKFSDEHLKNLSKSHIGNIPTPESIVKRTITRKLNGYTHTESTRSKIGNAQKGELNHNWNDGSSFEPYCSKFNESFKEHIRNEFNRECFLCGTHEGEQIIRQRSDGKIARRLSIHHVNYDKNCLCDDSMCKFVPLCSSCHSKTNSKRVHWEKEIMIKLIDKTNIEISGSGVSITKVVR